MNELLTRWVLDPFAWMIAGVAFGLVEMVLPTYFFLGMGLAGFELALMVWMGGGFLEMTGQAVAITLALLALLTVANWLLIQRFLPYRARNRELNDDINDY